MATYYVDSAAVGTNDGSSWTNAWTSITSAESVAGGSVILVADSHDENAAANLAIDFANGTLASPIHIISAETAGSTYSKAVSPQISTQIGLRVQLSGSVIYEGLYFRSNSDDCSINGATGELAIVRDCTLAFRYFLTGANSTTHFEGCTFTGENAGSSISVGSEGSEVTMDGCNLTGTWGTYFFQMNGARGSRLTARDCDFSVDTADLVNWGASNQLNKIAVFHNCKLNATTTAYLAAPANPTQTQLISHSDSGTLTAPHEGLHTFATCFGDVTSDLTYRRTGGANDGFQANPISWKMLANTTPIVGLMGLWTPPIARWVNAGSQTLTIYLATENIALNNDDFWVEVSSPSELGSATAQGKFRSTRMAPLATPAVLTTDTSTWTGFTTPIKYKIDVAITPTIAGPVTVRCHLAKPSTTVYVDPKIGVS